MHIPFDFIQHHVLFMHSIVIKMHGFTPDKLYMCVHIILCGILHTDDSKGTGSE